MLALAGVVVLVQRAAVEEYEALRVGREMRGHPVDQHADASLMEAIDEARKGLTAVGGSS